MRKAKEMLFTSEEVERPRTPTGSAWSTTSCRARSSASFTLALAERIARQPLFALKLAKEAVNAAQDAQGRVGAMQTSFALHQLCHSHNMQVHGLPIERSFMERFRTVPPPPA